MKSHLVKYLRTVFFIGLILIFSLRPALSFTVHDPINTAVNQIRNAIMNTQWVREIALAVDRLDELKAQTIEMLKFHSGLEEIMDIFVGNSLEDLLETGLSSLKNAFPDYDFMSPEIDILETSRGPEDIRASLERITGEIPEGNIRLYIPFEEMQVVDAFRLANEIRGSGQETRDFARVISEQAKTASPKGSGRLTAQATAQLMILNQQNQEALAKLLELQAVQIEQVSREEKLLEAKRIDFMEDASFFLDGILTSQRGGLEA